MINGRTEMIALDTELYYFLILAVLYPGYIVVSFGRGLHKHPPPWNGV